MLVLSEKQGFEIIPCQKQCKKGGGFLVMVRNQKVANVKYFVPWVLLVSGHKCDFNRFFFFFTFVFDPFTVVRLD